uniref:(California timema) hypothetical protein n=1 Tax=Timema californicum TaxID=61474 RepID=A0A7R9IZL2_TIMCA|nr:unnamed protein product [Timema californicum]
MRGRDGSGKKRGVRWQLTNVSCRRLDGLYQRSEEERLEKDPYTPFSITGCHCHQSLSRHQSIHEHSCLHPSSSSSEAFKSHRVTFSHVHPDTSGLRRSNTEKALTKKKRVVKMLFAVVLEFFICWTPLYVINTIALFNPNIVYYGLGYTAITFFQLLAYSSSCCNPITYCFMNSSFRKSFVNLFECKNVNGLSRIHMELGVLGVATSTSLLLPLFFCSSAPWGTTRRSISVDDLWWWRRLEPGRVYGSSCCVLRCHDGLSP